MAKDAHRVVMSYALWTFVFPRPNARYGYFETTGERRICFMATQPNRDSTLIWRRSSNSGGDGACVEVAESDSSVLVRDSRDQSGTLLKFTSSQWLGFVRRVKNADPGPDWPVRF